MRSTGAAASCAATRASASRRGRSRRSRRPPSSDADHDRPARLHRAARLDRHARPPRLALRSHGTHRDARRTRGRSGARHGEQRVGHAHGGFHDGAIRRRAVGGAAPRHDSRSRLPGPRVLTSLSPIQADHIGLQRLAARDGAAAEGAGRGSHQDIRIEESSESAPGRRSPRTSFTRSATKRRRSGCGHGARVSLADGRRGARRLPRDRARDVLDAGRHRRRGEGRRVHQPAGRSRRAELSREPRALRRRRWLHRRRDGDHGARPAARLRDLHDRGAHARREGRVLDRRHRRRARTQRRGVSSDASSIAGKRRWRRSFRRTRSPRRRSE